MNCDDLVTNNSDFRHLVRYLWDRKDQGIGHNDVPPDVVPDQNVLNGYLVKLRDEHHLDLHRKTSDGKKDDYDRIFVKATLYILVKLAMEIEGD